MKSISSFKNEFEFLSNFYRASFVHGCVVWNTVEHAFQAAKTLSIADANGIRDAETAAGAKKLGYRVKLRKDWEQIKVLIMTELVWNKFDQHPELRDKLLDTDSAELVEGNHWHDNFWGICQCGRDLCNSGKNILGLLLMTLRKDLMEKNDT